MPKSNWGTNILNSLKSGWKTALFMEAMRNLNWSRSYLWYVELDGVPNPFQRGGVLGLPCKDVQLTMNEADDFGWNNGIASFKVPKSANSLATITLTVVDDEQGTLRQFYERWFNEVYNPYYGVLPVTEACKQLSIYFQKSTRRNVKRVYYDIDKSVKSTVTGWANQLSSGFFDLGVSLNTQEKKVSDSLDFLVYPTSTYQLSLNAEGSNFITFTMTLQVAACVNQDFGNPNINSGVKTVFDQIVGQETDGSSWLDKIADYI